MEGSDAAAVTAHHVRQAHPRPENDLVVNYHDAEVARQILDGAGPVDRIIEVALTDNLAVAAPWGHDRDPLGAAGGPDTAGIPPSGPLSLTPNALRSRSRFSCKSFCSSKDTVMGGKATTSHRRP
ncbi:hypothetical protein AB0F52_09380 [Amycolatopsis sp. NPDC024027]|uniref:hypothetical protein n=1 Tax=Amycolatopsis sp. NPDC024027 TaxID=3154327 RepID=UPI0033E6E89A